MPMGTYCAAEAQNPGFFQAVSNNVAFEQGGYTEERARNKKALQSAYKKRWRTTRNLELQLILLEMN